MSRFGDEVNAAARAIGRAERTHLVPIYDVWDRLGQPAWASFERDLLRALRDGEVELERADLRTGISDEKMEAILDSKVVHPMSGAEYNYVVTDRQNPAPAADVDEARQMFEAFHRVPSKKTGVMHEIEMPISVRKMGKAVHVLYRSTKIDPETGRKPRGGAQNYIHEHDAGVCVYEPDNLDGDLETPQHIAEAETLVLLGKCLGIAFKDEEGRLREMEAEDPLPELYCTPDGKCLVVVQSKREILFVVWGGGLGVEPRGIVG